MDPDIITLEAFLDSAENMTDNKLALTLIAYLKRLVRYIRETADDARVLREERDSLRTNYKAMSADYDRLRLIEADWQRQTENLKMFQEASEKQSATIIRALTSPDVQWINVIGADAFNKIDMAMSVTPHQNIVAIRELRAATGLGLKDAKDMIDQLK
jgi:hypothetical protein